MRNEEFQMPRKFTFDEFYEMLKEFVNDPKVRELLATYDAEDALGQGDLLDGSQCSDLAFDAHSDFTMAGWKILAENGWPSFLEISNISNSTHRLQAMDVGDQFWRIGRRLIRKEPNQSGWDFQEENFDINDRDSVLRLLTLWQKRYGDPMPFELTGEI